MQYYVYDEEATPCGNLVRGSIWVAENVKQQSKRMRAMLERVHAEFPDPSVELVRDGLYGQLLMHAVTAWADGKHDAALCMLRKWRRRWDPITGADASDPGHAKALREWEQMKARGK